MAKKRTILVKLAYLGTSFLIVMLDQTTKAWAAKSLRFYGSESIIPNFLSLTYAENPGVAFSMFDGYGEAGRWVLSGVALVAGAGILYFFWRTPRTDDRLLSALGLLFAGVIGNVLDRVRIGYVIDFIDIQFGSWHYPTFNVADMAIVIGAGLLIIDMFRSGKEQKNDFEGKIES